MAHKKLKITNIESVDSDDTVPEKVQDTLDLTKPLLSEKLGAPTSSTSSPTTTTSDPKFGWVRAVTILTVLIWLLLVAGLLFIVLNIEANWQSYTTLQWATIAGLVLGSALLIFIASYALKQLTKLSIQAHRLSQTAHALSTPEKTVIGKSKTMVDAITAQIDQVDEKLNAAVGRLSSMEDVIKNQTQALVAANQTSQETVDKINTSVETQNATLSAMTASLDESMESLSVNLTMHTDNLAKSVQIAEQKIKEARISVEGATSKINSASDIVRSNTVQASATLSASHEDIKSLGDIIRQRSDELDTVYKKHANELTAMIEHLRDEQAALGASMEERLIKMRDLSLSAQASAESLSKASGAGKDTIEALAAAAALADGAVKTRFDEMRDMVQYSTEHAQNISNIAASRVQDSLEHTRKEIIRIEEEMADLQTRIGGKKRKSLELVPDDTSDDTNDHPSSGALPSKRKRTRLRLKPIIDIVPKKPETTQPETIAKEKQVAPEQAPLQLDENLIAPDTIRQKTEPLEVSPPETTSQQDLPQTVTSKNGTASTDEAVRRAAPLDAPKKQKSKPGLFRGLFGGRGETDEPSALDIVGSNAPKPLNPSPPPTDDEILLTDLTRLGLSANAVVDEGCIIEATNVRVSTGHEAMSRCVATRLKNPVEHLVKSLAVDDGLSDKAIIFATRFDRTIELLAGNREAIRTRLESEQGRAYLLCDAALNYGRV